MLTRNFVMLRQQSRRISCQIISSSQTSEKMNFGVRPMACGIMIKQGHREAFGAI